MLELTGPPRGMYFSLRNAMQPFPPFPERTSLEIGVCHFRMAKFDDMPEDDIKAYISEFRDDNIYAVAELLRRGESIESLHRITMITELFLESLKKIVDMESEIRAGRGDAGVLKEAKLMGFSDREIAELSH